MLSVSHVSKKFGTTQALSDVSFDVAHGEVVGLLGPNGAGKTTTMRILTGYYTPDAGSVAVGGITPAEDARAMRELVGYLPESNPLYKDLLVSEYLQACARYRSVPLSAYRSTFDRVVHDVGISDVFYKPIHTLSKGYRQRVGLAAALIGDPAVLVLDEPTEGLDPNQRGDMRALLTRLGREKTVLVSSHVLSEIEALASRVIVLHKGVVAASGTVQELARAKQGAVYVLDIEGPNAKRSVQGLSSVQSVEERSKSGKRVTLLVTVSDVAAFPPELSLAVGRERLTLWKLAPQGAALEDLFATLTREGVSPAPVL